MERKILLIEDDFKDRENIAEILELADFHVKTASNGKEGVLLAEQFLPDLIISNIIMPLLDGYGVLQILSKKKQLNKIPFIFITSKVSYQDMRKGMDLGADDYITKPFKESELISAIESRLSRIKTLKGNGEENLLNLNNTEELVFSQEKSIKEFLKKRKPHNYKKNESVYCEGNHSNHFFIVDKGLVKTFKISLEGKEFITTIFKKGDYVGLPSFIKNTAHFESATAIADTNLYKITREELCDLIKHDQLISRNIMTFLSDILIDSHEQLVHMAYGSVRKKTAIVLLNLAVKQPNNTYLLNISRSDLAHSIGIAKETLIRTLHDFKVEGLINIKRFAIEIIKSEKLKNIS